MTSMTSARFEINSMPDTRLLLSSTQHNQILQIPELIAVRQEWPVADRGLSDEMNFRWCANLSRG